MPIRLHPGRSMHAIPAIPAVNRLRFHCWGSTIDSANLAGFASALDDPKGKHDANIGSANSGRCWIGVAARYCRRHQSLSDNARLPIGGTSTRQLRLVFGHAGCALAGVSPPVDPERACLDRTWRTYSLEAVATACFAVGFAVTCVGFTITVVRWRRAKRAARAP